MQLYRILTLDDHPVVLEGVKHLLVGKTTRVKCDGVTSYHELRALLQNGAKYNLFILDLELPDDDGTEAINTIKQHCPQAAILVYTMHEEPWMMARLARMEIQGYVSKDSSVQRLVEAVSTIQQGGVSYGEPFARFAVGNADDECGNVELSLREQQVLDLIAKGMNTQQIARELFVSANTVGTYRHRLMQKFNAHNVAQLIAKSSQSNLR